MQKALEDLKQGMPLSVVLSSYEFREVRFWNSRKSEVLILLDDLSCRYTFQSRDFPAIRSDKWWEYPESHHV